MRRKGRTRKEQKNPKAGEAARKHIHKAYTSYGVEDCLKKWGIDVKEEVKS